MNIKLNPNKKTHIALVTILYAVFAYLINFIESQYKPFFLVSFIFYSYMEISYLRFLLNEKFVKLPKIKNILYFYLAIFICSAISVLPILIMMYFKITSNIYILISSIILMTYFMAITYPSLVNTARFERIKLSWKPSKLLCLTFLPIALLNYSIFTKLIEYNAIQGEIYFILSNIIIFFALRFNSKK